jgi:ABC-type uncharacterized transport system substrate-binding protein
MRRREVIALIGGAAVVSPGIGFAQAPNRRPIVAVMAQRSSKAMQRYMDALTAGLKESALISGRDYAIVLRSAESDPKRIPDLLQELIGLNPAVIMTSDTTITVAAKKETETIAIVGVGISDPEGFGLVTSLAHPEGNVTGLLSAIDRLVPKQLELLLQVVPSATRIGVMFNANNPANVRGAHLLQTERAALPIKVLPIELHSSTDIETAFQVLAREHAKAVLVFQDGIFLFNAAQIAALALTAKLPTVFGFREHVEAGGLISYGLNRADLWQRAGTYAAKILTRIPRMSRQI